jgi:predicted HD phosphohydrolase
VKEWCEQEEEMEGAEPGFEEATIVARQLMQRGRPLPSWLENDLRDDTPMGEEACPERAPLVGPEHQAVVPEWGAPMVTRVDKLKALFGAHGDILCGDGEVTYLSHALQASAWAETVMEPPAVIMAALCHDVGHMLALAGQQSEDTEYLGGHRAGVVGAQWLEDELWLGKAVTDPVRLHLSAMRYQAFKLPRYLSDQLGPSDRAAVESEDGAMTADEARRFEAHPWHKEALRVVAYHLAANKPGEPIWTLDEALAATEYGV